MKRTFSSAQIAVVPSWTCWPQLIWDLQSLILRDYIDPFTRQAVALSRKEYYYTFAQKFSSEKLMWMEYGAKAHWNYVMLSLERFELKRHLPRDDLPEKP